MRNQPRAVVLALAALVGLLLAACGGDSDPANPASGPRGALDPLPPGKYLYLVGQHRMTIVDVDAGVRWRVNSPRIATFAPRPILLRRGDRLVYYAGGGGIESIDQNLLEKPRVLLGPREPGSSGPTAAGYFLPSARLDRIWIASRPDARGVPTSVRELTADGRQRFPETELPRLTSLPYHRAPLVAFQAALGVSGHDKGTTSIWRPRRGAITSKIRSSAISPLASHGDLLAASQVLGQRLRLIDVTTMRERTVRPPRGFRGLDAFGAVFSPAGKYLALPVTRSGLPEAPLANRWLCLVDVAAGRARVVSGSAVRGGAHITWSSDGRSVFIGGRGRGEHGQVTVYRLGDRRAHRITITIGPVYGMAAS